MLKRTLLLVSVIIAGSLLVASNEGVSKKSINNDNVLSIENNVDLKQIESIGVSARNAIKNKLDGKFSYTKNLIIAPLKVTEEIMERFNTKKTVKYLHIAKGKHWKVK
jgi:hypothetical protein